MDALPYQGVSLPTTNHPSLSFRATAEESQPQPATTHPPPTFLPCHSDLVEESQPTGGKNVTHHKPSFPVIPTLWRNPNRPGARTSPTTNLPSLSFRPCGGIPTARGNHPSYPIPTLPLPAKGRERLGMAMTAPPRGWDSSAVARNDRRVGLGMAMTASPHRWDSSALPRNDRRVGLGTAMAASPHRWDSSAAARNDSQVLSEWQTRSGTHRRGAQPCAPTPQVNQKLLP